MKISYTYPKKNDITFITPFIGCDYHNNSFSICIGFLFWGIEEEKRTALRCRNCKHCTPNPNVPSWCRGNYCICNARTWGKNIQRNYATRPSQKACELFERKEE